MPLFIEKPILKTRLAEIKPGSEMAFADWQAKFNAAIASAPGFVSLEFLSPSGQQKGWLIVERFSTVEFASAWDHSTVYAELLHELSDLATKEGIKEVPSDGRILEGNVTELFVTEVNHAKDNDYRNWMAKIHQAEAKFPGFRGTYVQSPAEGKGKHWITLLQFNTMENLDNWLDSDERKQLLKESSPLITSLESHRVISPYAGWFASIAKAGEVPPVWKQTMIVLLVLFPIVMLELKYLSPLLAGLDVALGTFISNALSVALIAFPAMPVAIRLLGWWLTSSSLSISVIGALVVALLYLAEITLFWHFF